MRSRGTDARRLLLAAGSIIAAVLAVPAAASASSAVVLVSGFDTATPFSTSDPSCAGQEGPTWSNANGPAAALKAAGLTVFTAPVAQSGSAAPAPCLGTGQQAPPAGTAIDSNGDVDANGAALVSLLEFLRSSYGVDTVQLVGHSDGGLWSRSAITQLSPSAGVTVQSLTTLATPHTGSFGADLAETLVNGQCEESNEVEQIICEAALATIDAVFDDLGPTTVKQLSSTFLEGWNPQQTIGCPVAVMGGTYVDIPLIDFSYYNPNDGIVGKASALNVEALSITLSEIPAAGFTPIGGQTFPVVHSSVLTFLSPNTMLNQADISADVLAAVQAGASSQPCLAATTAPTRAVNRLGTRAKAPVRVHAGFRSMSVPGKNGVLRVKRRGSTVALLGGARLRCHGTPVPSRPVLGSQELRMAIPQCGTRLKVLGGRALELRAAPERWIRVTRGAGTINVRVAGPRLLDREAHVRVGGRWRALRVNRDVPLRARGDVAVRVTGRDGSGERFAATAHVAG